LAGRGGGMGGFERGFDSCFFELGMFYMEVDGFFYGIWGVNFRSYCKLGVFDYTAFCSFLNYSIFADTLCTFSSFF
jgi:hypothetical protein